MSAQQKNKCKNEVYSVSGFKDTLASPVFYPVIVVAMLLGITSMFGFVQNPLKLKSMVNVIHQKVATTNVVNGTLENKLYNVSNINKSKNIPLSEYSVKSDSNKSFNLYSQIDTGDVVKPVKMPVEKNIERIVFNYDVTSENFWADLDSSKFESATEEMERKQRDKATIGAPLEIYQQERPPTKLNEKSIYALNSSDKF